MKPITMLLAVGMVLVLAVTAWAGPDWEYSARHHALAETGNAVFNVKGMSSTLENIACLVGSPEYTILFEGIGNNYNGITSQDDADYNYRNITGKLGLKTTYVPMGRKDTGDFAGRLAISFQPGLYAENYYLKKTYTEAQDDLVAKDDEYGEAMTLLQSFYRLGGAYGINKYVAVGLGFTLIPVNLVTIQHDGEILGNDPQDDWTILSTLMFSPELGVLVRPVPYIQLGVSSEMGDLKSRKAEVSHKTSYGDFDVENAVITARSPSLGLGFAIDIPNIEKFFVATDVDIEFRRGSTVDTNEALAPVEGGGDLEVVRQKNTIANADNQLFQWSSSIEKAWKVASIKGGIGYADEVGTKHFQPYDRFFMTFGSDLYFDEHVMMGFSLRSELGYLEADPSTLAFGGGFAWTFGGSF
jgi:hypothetical protein